MKLFFVFVLLIAFSGPGLSTHAFVQLRPQTPPTTMSRYHCVSILTRADGKTSESHAVGSMGEPCEKVEEKTKQTPHYANFHNFYNGIELNGDLPTHSVKEFLEGPRAQKVPASAIKTYCRKETYSQSCE